MINKSEDSLIFNLSIYLKYKQWILALLEETFMKVSCAILHVWTSCSSKWCFTSSFPKYSWMRYTLLRISPSVATSCNQLRKRQRNHVSQIKIHHIQIQNNKIFKIIIKQYINTNSLNHSSIIDAFVIWCNYTTYFPYLQRVRANSYYHRLLRSIIQLFCVSGVWFKNCFTGSYLWTVLNWF